MKRRQSSLWWEGSTGVRDYKKAGDVVLGRHGLISLYNFTDEGKQIWTNFLNSANRFCADFDDCDYHCRITFLMRIDVAGVSSIPTAMHAKATNSKWRKWVETVVETQTMDNRLQCIEMLADGHMQLSCFGSSILQAIRVNLKKINRHNLHPLAISILKFRTDCADDCTCYCRITIPF